MVRLDMRHGVHLTEFLYQSCRMQELLYDSASVITLDRVKLYNVNEFLSIFSQVWH